MGKPQRAFVLQNTAVQNMGGTARTRVTKQNDARERERGRERQRENALNLDDNIIIFRWDGDT